MFNVSGFKKVVKLLGRKVSNVDEFCKEVKLYMEAEKLAVREKIVNLYTFDELSPEGQKKALDTYRDINVDQDWWDYTYDDAEQVGLKITSFDIDRRDIEGYFVEHPSTVITTIIQNHGDMTETYKTAMKYKDAFTLSVDEDVEQEFLKELLEDYLQMLSKEYDYLTSDEAIKEKILANEYEFTENGKIEASKKTADKYRDEMLASLKLPLSVRSGREILDAEGKSLGYLTYDSEDAKNMPPVHRDEFIKELVNRFNAGRQAKKTADYNGYKNYETWNVDLWLGNNQFEAPEELTDLHELADYIKEMVEEGNPLADAESSMYADLLNSALSEVDYRQIAQFRLDVEE